MIAHTRNRVTWPIGPGGRLTSVMSIGSLESESSTETKRVSLKTIIVQMLCNVIAIISCFDSHRHNIKCIFSNRRCGVVVKI